MRVVSYHQFLQLPSGTIFSYIDYPHKAVHGLFRKGITTSDSYMELPLFPVYTYNPREKYKLQDKEWDAVIRDKRQKYVVYEEEDVFNLGVRVRNGEDI